MYYVRISLFLWLQNAEPCLCFEHKRGVKIEEDIRLEERAALVFWQGRVALNNRFHVRLLKQQSHKPKKKTIFWKLNNSDRFTTWANESLRRWKAMGIQHIINKRHNRRQTSSLSFRLILHSISAVCRGVVPSRIAIHKISVKKNFYVPWWSSGRVQSLLS